jgi:hypothetical protein
MIDVDALVAKAEALVRDAEPEVVPIVVAGEQFGARFLPMMGSEWRALVLKHPPRTDVMQDLNLGYNVDDVVSSYPHIAVIKGDQVDDMWRTDEEGKRYSAWPTFYGAATANSQKDLATAIWAAHERTPDRLVSEAGKASAGSGKKKRI